MDVATEISIFPPSDENFGRYRPGGIRLNVTTPEFDRLQQRGAGMAIAAAAALVEKGFAASGAFAEPRAAAEKLVSADRQLREAERTAERAKLDHAAAIDLPAPDLDAVSATRRAKEAADATLADRQEARRLLFATLAGVVRRTANSGARDVAYQAGEVFERETRAEIKAIKTKIVNAIAGLADDLGQLVTLHHAAGQGHQVGASVSQHVEDGLRGILGADLFDQVMASVPPPVEATPTHKRPYEPARVGY